MRAEKKVEKVARKIVPLPGYLLAQRIKCGRPNCRCASGSLHGPYYYHVYNAGGVRFKAYVRKADLAATRAGIQEYRRHRARIRAIDEQIKADWQAHKSRLREINDWLKSRRRSL